MQNANTVSNNQRFLGVQWPHGVTPATLAILWDIAKRTTGKISIILKPENGVQGAFFTSTNFLTEKPKELTPADVQFLEQTAKTTFGLIFIQSQPICDMGIRISSDADLQREMIKLAHKMPEPVAPQLGRRTHFGHQLFGRGYIARTFNTPPTAAGVTY